MITSRRDILSRMLVVGFGLRSRMQVATYRHLLGGLGRDVSIHPDVTLNWPERIDIGNRCMLYRGAYLNARTTHEIGIHLGDDVKIHEYTYVDPYGGTIDIDDGAGIGQHCWIAGHGGLYVGRLSMIGGGTYIIPANHGHALSGVPYVLQEEDRRGIHIGNNVWIGAGCCILAGTSLGDGCVVGAGSVVVGDYPPDSIIYGVKAECHGTTMGGGSTPRGWALS